MSGAYAVGQAVAVVLAVLMVLVGDLRAPNRREPAARPALVRSRGVLSPSAQERRSRHRLLGPHRVSADFTLQPPGEAVAPLPNRHLRRLDPPQPVAAHETQEAAAVAPKRAHPRGL